LANSVLMPQPNRIYRYAARRLGWTGTNPVSVMLTSERPKPSQSKRRRIFEGPELEQTIAAAKEPWRTLFTLAAITGARVSELLALTWADVRLKDLDDAEIEFAWQSIGAGSADRSRPTGRRGQFRSLGSSRWCSRDTSSRRLAGTRTTSCSPRAREDRCASGMSDERCELRNATL
jgi:hypothetical protein